MSQVNLITLSLSPPYPDNGMVPIVARLRGQDKLIFDLAAYHMGMNKSVLMRILLVKGAEKILQELGVKVEYEQNDRVDLTKGETLV
jgi:hypothetical protein